MNRIRISAVKYANTYPFIFGLKHSGFSEKAIIETDHPAQCAAKLVSGAVDMGLIPVAALPMLPEYHIASNYCIGASGKVKTVMLLSNSPFDSIDTVYLDYRSLTSVNLTRVLARNFWKKEFAWKQTGELFDFTALKPNEAVTLIGDQCFQYEQHFTCRTDLALEWKRHTGLPFVFACWAANKKIDAATVGDFNSALKHGVENIPAVVAEMGQVGVIKGTELEHYLTRNIDFNLDEPKEQALKLFLSMLSLLQ
ncbi:MAG: menaquinone biosynthesis protein [Bacteroidales bacterium]|jgi:chorismate dehydratase|nr:menaquinone biosynthesis protein [Bacteroidales bacterium]